MKRFKKGMRFIVKMIFRLLLITVFLAAICLIGLFWWLHEKPMNLTFLMPQIQQYALKEKPDLKLEAESVYLSAEMRRSGLFHIRIQNMSLLGKNEELILDLPIVEVSYGLMPLLTLNYLPTSIQVEDALLQLTLTKNNQLLLEEQETAAFDEEVSEDPVSEETHEQKKAFMVGDINHLTKNILKFKNIVLKQGALVINDEKMHRRIVVPQINFSLKRRRFTHYEIKADAKVRMQRDLMAFKTTALYNVLAQTIEFDVFFNQLNLSRFARAVPLLEGIKVLLEGEINGSLDIAEGSKHWRNAFKTLHFNVKTNQKGEVQLPQPLNTIYPVQEIMASGSFSPNLNSLKIQPIKVSLTTGLKADVDIQTDKIGAFLDQNDFNLVQTTLNARINNIPMKEVPQVWPAYLGPDAHQWVYDNLKTGTATTALFTLYFSGATISDLVGDVDFKDTTVDYLNPMKPIQKAGGKVMLYPDKVEIFANTGFIDNIQLNTANVYLTDLQAETPSQAKIELDVTGPVSEVLTLINEKPLCLLSGMNINPAQVTGEVSGQATLSFPLTENLTPKDVVVNVKASASNAAFSTMDKQFNLKNMQAGVVVDNEGLLLQGNGIYQKIPVDIRWEEIFMPQKEDSLQTIYTVSGSVSDLFVAPYFEDISDYLIGIIKGKLIYQKQKNKTAQILFNTQLDQAELMLYPIAYTKVKGVPAILEGEVQLNPNNAVEWVRFDLSADKKALDISGKIQKTKKKTSILLNKVKAPGSDFSMQFEMEDEKNLKLNLKGKSWLLTEFKNTPYFKKQALTIPDKTGIPSVVNTPAPAVDIDVSLNSLTLNLKAPLKKVMLKAKRKGYKWNKLFVFAQGNDAFSINLTPQTDKVDGLVNDIGDLLNRLNLSSEFSHGKAVLSGKQAETGYISGNVQIKNLDFKNPGFITQALTILGIVDAVRGKELTFSQGSIPFELSPRFLLKIQDGVLYGTSLGITFTGEASPDFLKMSGSVIPAYAVNSLPGRIPLIGSLFRTAPNGGLMGVMYDLTGTLSSPKVTFNPLSSIAPGILSQLFR